MPRDAAVVMEEFTLSPMSREVLNLLGIQEVVKTGPAIGRVTLITLLYTKF